MFPDVFKRHIFLYSKVSEPSNSCSMKPKQRQEYSRQLNIENLLSDLILCLYSNLSHLFEYLCTFNSSLFLFSLAGSIEE